jgi:large subunit ribosomal protein L32e
MVTEVKRLIRVRVEKGASFKRDGFGKKRQISDSWRKPRGQHNKQREQKKAKGALPKPGFGSPVAVRSMHPSGYFEVLISNVKELEGLDPKTQAVRIGATVGTRKRVIIQEQAVSAGLKVLNARVAKAPVKKAPAKKAEAKEVNRKNKEAKKPVAPKKSADKVKKEVVKGKPAEKTEEKKAPTKKAVAAKPKAEKVAEPVESPKKKAPTKKSTKVAAKPKAEKTAETKSKAAATPKAKTIKSGVKKNE